MHDRRRSNTEDAEHAAQHGAHPPAFLSSKHRQKHSQEARLAPFSGSSIYARTCTTRNVCFTAMRAACVCITTRHACQVSLLHPSQLPIFPAQSSARHTCCDHHVCNDTYMHVIPHSGAAFRCRFHAILKLSSCRSSTTKEQAPHRKSSHVICYVIRASKVSRTHTHHHIVAPKTQRGSRPLPNESSSQNR